MIYVNPKPFFIWFLMLEVLKIFFKSTQFFLSCTGIPNMPTGHFKPNAKTQQRKEMIRSGFSYYKKVDKYGAFLIGLKSRRPRLCFYVNFWHVCTVIFFCRLSTENLLEPVTRELDFQLQPPFLLYKYEYFSHLAVPVPGIYFVVR